MSDTKTNFVPLAPIEVVKANGARHPYGFGAATNAARGTALQAAKTFATSGDTIYVHRGTYDTKNLLKDGVNYHFDQGAIVDYTGSAYGCIWDDSVDHGTGAGVTCRVTGHGIFRFSGTVPGTTASNWQSTGSQAGAVWIGKASSDVYIEGDRFEITGDNTIPDPGNVSRGDATTIWQEEGRLVLKAHEGIYDYWQGDSVVACFYWLAGYGIIDAPEIISTSDSDAPGHDAVSFAARVGNTDDCYVRADTIETVNGRGVRFTSPGNDDTSWAMWVDCLTCKGGDGAVISRGGKGYLTAQKTYGVIETSAAQANQILYLRTMKAENDATTLGPILKLQGLRSFINIDELKDLGGTTDKVIVDNDSADTDGVHELTFQSLLCAAGSTGDAIQVSQTNDFTATLNIHGGRIVSTNSGKDLRATSAGIINVSPSVKYDPARVTESLGGVVNRNAVFGTSITTAGLAILDDASAAAQRVTLGVEKRLIVLFPFAPTADVATGDGKAYFRVPTMLNGGVITAVHAMVNTAGTTGGTTIQIARVRSGTPADVLSAAMVIDSGETGSDTGTAGTINTSNDDLATGDIIRIDVDGVSTTEPLGLQVTIEVTL
jgi:hypothetical protein